MSKTHIIDLDDFTEEELEEILEEASGMTMEELKEVISEFEIIERDNPSWFEKAMDELEEDETLH